MMRSILTAATERNEELFNGRINRNHKKDSENLHQYRLQKVTAGKRTVRKQHYKIQPHDIVIYENRKRETAGCHCNGTRMMLLPDKSRKNAKTAYSSPPDYETKNIVSSSDGVSCTEKDEKKSSMPV